jgi:hypothetical protein
METIFRTHTGEIVSGITLSNALNQVANDMTQTAYNIRFNSHYADHVTEEQKDTYYLRRIERAEQIRIGNGLISFAIWQHVNEVLTGECVPFLPK